MECKKENKDENIIIIYNGDTEQYKTNSKLLNLPDYLIEAYIFPYLSWRELFFTVRGTHSYLHDIVKSTWSNIIKEEMCNQLKNLTFLYEKDALEKAYEFKYQYLINYRNLLVVYYLNANILNILELCLDYIEEQNIFKLLATFFGILGQEQCLNTLFEENLDNNNKKKQIIELLNSQVLIDDFKNKMEIILDINSIESDTKIFKELNDDFNGINREIIEEQNNNCRLLYSFLQGILEYQNLKKNVQELKLTLEQLYIKIQNETKLWPKRKKFFETAYKILLNSKSTTYKFRYMNNLYLKYSVKSPFCEYKEESYNSMVELRNKMEIKKTQIIEKLKNNHNYSNNSNENLMDEVNDILLKNVLDRRLLLTKKILITEKFYDIINDPNSSCKKINNGESYNIKGEIIYIEELLKTLLLLSNVCPDDISIDSVLKLYKIKKNLEKKQMKENIDNKGSEIISKNEAINIEKRSEIILLKNQKQNLINQKKKTEKMLNILKKYMELKENFLKNKQKYKSILFILSKMRQKKIENIESNQTELNIDKIVELLDCENIEDIFTNYENFKNLSKEEEQELQSFEINEGLLKEIETSLLQKIKKLLDEEKNFYIKNNEINVNTSKKKQKNKIWENLGIQKGVNINVNGSSINVKSEEDEK